MMGTRSNIIYEEPNGEVLSMYCHYDGYLDYNGRILLDQYNSAEKAKALVEIGYTRSLKPKRMEIDPERPNEMERHRNLNSYMLGVDPGFIEFIYLWNCKEGKWWVATNVVMNLDNAYNRYVVYHTKFTPLTEMLKELDAA
tara:strand:- start:29 stop:451 length:423 start_codon:yes stop_codon:yes gene_type:complete